MSFITQPSGFGTKSKFKFSAVQEPKQERFTVDIQTSKWSKMLRQFRLAHESQSQTEQVKRGCAFFRQFLKEDYLQKIPVEVSIPETMLMDDDENLYMLYREKNRLRKKRITVEQYQTEVRKTNVQLMTKIGKSSAFSTEKFLETGSKSYSQIKPKIKSNIEYSVPYKFKYKPYVDFNVNPLVPYIMCRKDSADTEQIFQKEILNFKNFNEIKLMPQHEIIYQRYVFSRNLKAMIIRLCYHTSSNESSQSDFAYRYQNKNSIFKYHERSDTYETGIPLSTVSPTEIQQYTFEASKIVGKSLLPYQKMARSIVNYLEKVNSIRINKLYLDFIVDINEEVWFTNLKFIELGPSIRLGSLNLSSATITCTVYCKLCGIIHRRDEVSKTLTFKLLYELVQHLKKRTRRDTAVHQLLHDLKFNQNMNIPCQLCDVCYKLVVSQHELIEVEKQMARTMNIKINEQIAIETNNSKNRKRPAYLADDLYQWRLMLYLSELKHFKELQNNIYIQYRINGVANLGGCYKIQGSQDSIFLNYIRLHYFFSQSLNIQRLLNESQLVIRLTNGSDWNKYIAQGSSGTVSHFKNNIETGQRHSPTILIFDNSEHYSELHLTIGLVCDGKYNTSELSLHREKDVYLPDPSYHNCNPLPKEWMEMFSPKYALKMMDQEEKSQDVVNFGMISREISHKHLRMLFKKC